jgi:hypothetical protein
MAGYIGSKGSGIISGIDASIADLNLTDKASANGTTEANKVLTADGNKDVTAIRNLTATGNVTATGTVTRALTRGSIDVGNSSGVSSALAKGAAGTVLTSDGTDLSFVAASGGGEQEFTATGAITAGNLVGLTSSGTISVVEAELQAAVAQGSGAADSAALVYDTANDKVLLFFKGTSNYLYGRVGTVSNGQISFGTAATTSATALDMDAAYDVNSGKTVVTYNQNDGNNYAMAVVVTVSGTSLSFGTPVTLRSSGTNTVKVEYDSNAQKVLFVYDGGAIYGRVGTVSGTTISLGTQTQVSVSNSTYGGTDLSFDSTANKFILTYIISGAGVPTVKVLTISGTSVSGGTEVNGNSLTNGTRFPQLTYIPSLNKTVLISSYAGSYWYYYILTVSGTDITITNGIRYDETISSASGKGYLIVAGDKRYIQYYETAGTYNTLLEVSVTATEITFAPLTTKVQWGTGASSYYPAAVYDPDTGSLINADATNVRVYNVTAPDFVGIAAENISDGATGKATVVGGINTSVSGLTAGKSYAITPSSASLSVAGIDEAGSIGIALSSSSIYLNVGSI